MRFLTDKFLDKYRSQPPPFGLGKVSDLVFRRTYSRLKPDGSKESWVDCVQRVVEATFRHQRDRIETLPRAWCAGKARRAAESMFEKIWSLKFLPPGRGLWSMGSETVEGDEKSGPLGLPLNNCAFVSTRPHKQLTPAASLAKACHFMMDASMLGVGVSFDTEGAGLSRVGCRPSDETEKISAEAGPITHAVADSRKGWCLALRAQLERYLRNGEGEEWGPEIVFDYSKVRPLGTPLKKFGGVASGPGPLRDLIESLKEQFESRAGALVDSELITNVMNLIGKCVVSGNVRRSAQLALGKASDSNFLGLKDYERHPERVEFGWSSNNTVVVEPGKCDYSEIAGRVALNGEPGIFWKENAQKYGRMGDPPTWADHRAEGCNPCGEQTLESYEVCCLVEIELGRIDTYLEFEETLKSAFLYAKTVTLLSGTGWEETTAIINKNRRIGCSPSGIAQFLAKHTTEELRSWLDRGYAALRHFDELYSEFFGVNTSIKRTTVKPSGTTSLLVGATPGIHAPEDLDVLRRVRLAKTNPLVESLIWDGYHVEPEVGKEKTAVVVTIPISYALPGIRTLSQVGMWEQLERAALLQEWWSDNQVSVTVTFDPETEGPSIKAALELYERRLKSVAFLPRKKVPHGSKTPYPQMPIEGISHKTYLAELELVAERHAANIAQAARDGARSPAPSSLPQDAEMEMFCNTDYCILRRAKSDN